MMLSSACFSQWFSQPLPVSGQVNDLKFFDGNTGLISMNPAIALRTTNGGYNWLLILPGQYVGNFEIIDSSTVYANGMSASGYGMLLRTYNRGVSWDSLPLAGSWTVNGISFVNRDTGWVGGTAGALPFLWRTTNAGVTWTVQSDDTGFGKVFFLKQKVNGEYVGWSQFEAVATYKTTNSGVNWFQIQNVGNVNQIYFINENSGWTVNGDRIKRTTNGGLNWTQHYMPTDNGIILNFISNIKVINKDTLYGDWGLRQFPNGQLRGVIWISTNGGVNWGFQQPDTSIGKRFSHIDFINKDTGWSSWIRTNNGGGPVIYPTYIDSNSAVIPSNYVLKQNYPNPFNPSTTIEFSLPKDSYVKMKITDISGRTVFWVIYDMLLYSGLHRFKITDFSRLSLPSGVYFYRLEAREKNNGKTYFTPSRKMLYIK